MSRPSRRTLLRGASAAVLGSVAVAPLGAHAALTGPSPASPDADLIAACEEWLRIQAAFARHVASLPGDIPDDDPAWRILERKDVLEERIITARAATAEGQLLRLRVAVALWAPNAPCFCDDPNAAFEDRLRSATLRDAKALERT